MKNTRTVGKLVAVFVATSIIVIGGMSDAPFGILGTLLMVPGCVVFGSWLRAGYRSLADRRAARHFRELSTR